VADAGLLQVEQNVRGGKSLLSGRHVRQESVRRVEDPPSVREADEGLHGVDAVVLDAGIVRVRAAQEADVVVALHARVVVLDGDEERLSEAVAAAEVEGGIGERPLLAADGETRPGVRTGAILACALEAELVEKARRDRRGEPAEDRARRILPERLRAAPP